MGGSSLGGDLGAQALSSVSCLHRVASEVTLFFCIRFLGLFSVCLDGPSLRAVHVFIPSPLARTAWPHLRAGETGSAATLCQGRKGPVNV